MNTGPPAGAPVAAETPTAKPDGGDNGYGSSWMRQAVQKRVNAERAAADPRAEVKKYLQAPLDESCTDTILWWRVCSFTPLTLHFV